MSIGGLTMFVRNYYLNQLIMFKDTDFIKVLTGVRRSGKSVLLMQYHQYLMSVGIAEAQIIYLNFESYENIDFLDDKRLYEYVKSKERNERLYLLFDEIQDVLNWQKVVNGIRTSLDCEIVVTGSNAKMLSGELATFLSGRYVEIKVYPFSFKELVQIKLGEEYDVRLLPNLYKEYVRYGGFPAVVMASDNMKETILSGINDTVVLNDVANRGTIRDISALKRITGFLADNIGQLVSSTNISNTLSSNNLKVTVPTVIKYIELMENAFLFYHVKRYDIRGREYLYQQGKYYIVDSGLRSSILGSKMTNVGSLLENIVYIELLRRGYKVDVGKLENKEIDFVARKSDKIFYVQVALELPQGNRESDNLLLIRDNYKKIIITERLESVNEIDGIPIINIVDWLMEVEGI
jgi:predicted AAA+ superfamily ATPase